MTPKEKADEILNRFYDEVGLRIIAEQCALICIAYMKEAHDSDAISLDAVEEEIQKLL